MPRAFSINLKQTSCGNDEDRRTSQGSFGQSGEFSDQHLPNLIRPAPATSPFAASIVLKARLSP